MYIYFHGFIPTYIHAYIHDKTHASSLSCLVTYIHEDLCKTDTDKQTDTCLSAYIKPCIHTYT